MDKNSTKNTHDDANKTSPLQEPSKNTEDAELDDLLDSALEDFDKPLKPTTNERTHTDAASTQEDETGNWDQIFNGMMTGSPEEQLQKMMETMKSDDPSMFTQFENLASAANNIENTEESMKSFNDTLKGTLDGLAQSASNLPNDVGEEDFLKMMGSMNLNGPPGEGGEGDGFMPFMQGMMKNLFSKDVLYPPLKEIATKFPSWIEENQDKVASADMERYKKQLVLMNTICQEFEKQESSTSTTTDAHSSQAPPAEHTNNVQFDRILDLMQEMQDLGQPPADLVGSSDMEGAEGMPKMPFMPGMPGMPPGSEQCSIM